jgi:hypothetical protein
MPDHLLRWLLLLPAVVAVTLGCSDPADEESTSVCRTTSEFDIAGCAVLAGQVVDTEGRPLTDVHVGYRALRPCDCTEFFFEVGPGGEFRQTVDQFTASSEPNSDTLTVMVQASASGSQYPQPTPTTFITDSAPAVLTFRPKGELPVVTFVQIRLPIPQ